LALLLTGFSLSPTLFLKNIFFEFLSKSAHFKEILTLPATSLFAFLPQIYSKSFSPNHFAKRIRHLTTRTYMEGEIFFVWRTPL